MTRPSVTWLITDTHFGHDNIIQYCHRPFKNSREMNDRIVELWNRHVMPEDLVFHLGDVALGLAPREVSKIVWGLAGKKILVVGNHDHYKSAHWWMTSGGFAFAAMGIEWRGVWLTHHPASALPPSCYLNVHGHLHNLDAKDPAFAQNPDNKGGHEGGDKAFNKLLCLEREGYKPVNWDQWVPKDPYEHVRP